MNPRLRDLLYRSFDGTLSDEERRQLDAALDRSPALREEYGQIVTMRRMIARSATRSFGPWFAMRVMQRIAEAAPGADLFFETLFRTFRRVALAASIAAIALAAYNLSQSDTVSLAATFGFSEPALEQMLDVMTAFELEETL
jgi:anti-sigma factor RsiW